MLNFIFINKSYLNMKLHQFITFVLSTIVLFSCSPNYEREIAQIDGLSKILTASEEVLHSVNRDSLFEITQLVKEDIKRIQSKNDTLTREAAFKADEYVGRLKHLNRLYINYGKMEDELNTIKTQLNNLKQDLQNGLIQQKDFLTYYESEKTAVILINDKIAHSTNGMSHNIRKMFKNRAEFVALIEAPASYKSYKTE